MDSQAATSEAAERGPCVLLDQCVTLSGRKLEIRVTAKNETNPDTVVVHVEYGTGHAKVTVKDNGHNATQKGNGKRKSRKKSGSATDRTEVGERGAEEDSSLSGEGTRAPRPSPGIAQACVSGGKAAGACPYPNEEHQDTTTSSSKDGDATEASTEAGAKSEKSVSAGEASVPLAQRTELHIRSHDPPGDLDDEMLEEILRLMPALRSLKIDWRADDKKLNIDIVSQYCRHLREIDLSNFRLDVWSLEQLCAACPDLEAVKLPRKCVDEHVEVLNRLTCLRSLDLEKTQITGCFLDTFEVPIEKLSMAKCLSLDVEEVKKALYYRNSSLPLHGLRELDLSAIDIGGNNLIEILKCSPRLQRLTMPADTIGISTCLVQLGQCKDLRELDLSLKKPTVFVPRILPSDLTAFLSGCPKLQRLALDECSFESSTCLRYLANCPELRDLSLYDIVVKLPVGSELPHYHNVDPTDVAAGLSGCPLLERLSVARIFSPVELLVPPTGLPKLTYLNASTSGLTDNSLRHLPQMFPRLRTLIISNCLSVSGDALGRCLPRLKELRALNLTNTSGASPDVVNKLKRRCPLLEITCS